MGNRNRKVKIIVLMVIILSVFAGWIIWENTSIDVSRITIFSERLPESFFQYKIAHVSDLHNTEFGKDNSKLLRKIRAENQPSARQDKLQA